MKKLMNIESSKKLKNEWSLMLVPMIFFYRRLLYIYSAIVLGKYLLVQLAIQISMILLYLTILHTLRPLESRVALR